MRKSAPLTHSILRHFMFFRGTLVFWMAVIGIYAIYFYNTIPYGFTVQSAEREHCGVIFTDYQAYQDAVALDLDCRLTLGESSFSQIDPSRLDESVYEPGNDVLVEYEPTINEKIIEGKLVIKADTLDIAQQVTVELQKKFGDDIIAIRELFPNTDLLYDLVVEYHADSKSYLDITTYLSTITEFEEEDLTTGEVRKLVRVNPNISFEHLPAPELDEKSRNNALVSIPNSDGFGVQSVELDLTQRYLDHIGYRDIQQCLPEGRSIKIAVVDNGFDLAHPDLQNRIFNSYDAADKDENAQVPSYEKERNHGTKEAGIIGAEQNDFGIDGIVPNAELILIKSTRDTANGRDVTNGIEGIAKAYELGAEVINLSRGGYGNVPLLERVTKRVASQGVKIVAAAGNYSNNQPFYPAAYDRVISVSAIDKQNEKASFSNYGTWVDIAAPGVDIITTDLNNTYNPYNGTSEASPIVAGSLALAMSHGLAWKDLSNHSLDIGNELLGVGMIDLRFMCDAYQQIVSEADAQLSTHGVAPSNKIKSRMIIFLLSMISIMFSIVTSIIDLFRYDKEYAGYHT